MATLYGNFERSLDAQGPADTSRKAPGGVRGERVPDEPSWTVAWRCTTTRTWRSRRRRMRVRSKGSQDDRMIARIWSLPYSEVTFDAQGRFPLPPASRSWAGLGRRGVGDRSDRQGRALVTGQVRREGRIRQHADSRRHEYLRYRRLTPTSMAERETEKRLTRQTWLMRSPSTGAVEVTSSALFPPDRPGYPPDGVSSVEGLRMIPGLRPRTGDGRRGRRRDVGAPPERSSTRQ